MIGILDYDAGNLGSVQKAVAFLGGETQITDDPRALLAADKLILPGVGAFRDAADSLKRKGLDKVIREFIASGKPFLGICLGLQLLFEHSEEGGAEGLGLFKGRVARFPASLREKGLKIPQIGWNCLDITRPDPLFTGLDGRPFVYFVHSYYLTGADAEIVSATCEYGVTVQAAAQSGNVFLTQFHPEKSGKTGLRMLQNFLAL
jgi:glutamine amidotransferase